MRKKTAKGQCVYCLEHGEITRDHVISRCLFPEKYEKTDLIIASSCESCNKGFSKDEEYFRQFLCNFSMEHSEEANDLFFTKIKRSIERRPQIGHKAMSNMELVDCYTKGGIYLGKKTKVNLPDEDWKRYHNVLNKYIKGLFYNEFNEPMPSDYKMKHILGERSDSHLNIIKHLNNWNKNNKEVFVYAYNNVPDSYSSIWLTIYYDTVFFITFVLTDEDYKKFEKIEI